MSVQESESLVMNLRLFPPNTPERQPHETVGVP